LRNDPYGLSIPIDKYNRDFLITRARRVDPDEVQSRTPLYGGGGLVKGAAKALTKMAEKYAAKAPEFITAYRGSAAGNAQRSSMNTGVVFMSRNPEIAKQYGDVVEHKLRGDLKLLDMNPDNPEARRVLFRTGDYETLKDLGINSENDLKDPDKFSELFAEGASDYALGLLPGKHAPAILKAYGYQGAKWGDDFWLAGKVDDYLAKPPVKERTPGYAAGGAVRAYDPTEIDAIVAEFTRGYSEGGLKTHDGFDAVENPDGSVSTEISITVQDPRLNEGRPTNIPSLWERKVVDDDTAVERALKSGKRYTSYDTIEEAVRAARQRSSDLGTTLHKAGGGLAKAVAKGLTKVVREALPQTEREENLRKFLESSKVKERLYHGTKAHDDYADQPGQAFGQFTGRPTWLAQEPYTASGYSGGTGSTYPVFAQIKKPLILTFDANDDANKAFKTAELLGVDVEHIKRMSKPEKAWEVINHPAFIDAVEKAGYDGLAINEGGYKTFGLLDPRKIKSAIGNRGTYDIAEPDITKAAGGLVNYDPTEIDTIVSKLKEEFHA